MFEDIPDPAERVELAREDRLVAALVDRCAAGADVRAAAELSPNAQAVLRTVLAVLRATGSAQ